MTDTSSVCGHLLDNTKNCCLIRVKKYMCRLMNSNETLLHALIYIHLSHPKIFLLNRNDKYENQNCVISKFRLGLVNAHIHVRSLSIHLTFS